MFRHVQVATDYGVPSERAFHHGLAIALRARGVLELVHVATGGEDRGFAGFPRVRDTLARWGALEPDAHHADVHERFGVEVRKSRLESRDVVNALADHARRHADLLVLATHAPSGLDRWIEPSVAEAVVRTAQVPTLLLPIQAPGFIDPLGVVRLSRVLVPVADEPSPLPAVDAVGELARLFDVALAGRLLHVGADPPLVDPPATRAAWDLVVRAGDPDAVIAAEVRAWPADLVVMVSRGHDSLGDRLLGNHAERVASVGACPVLVLPPEHAG